MEAPGRMVAKASCEKIEGPRYKSWALAVGRETQHLTRIQSRGCKAPTAQEDEQNAMTIPQES